MFRGESSCSCNHFKIFGYIMIYLGEFGNAKFLLGGNTGDIRGWLCIYKIFSPLWGLDAMSPCHRIRVREAKQPCYQVVAKNDAKGGWMWLAWLSTHEPLEDLRSWQRKMATDCFDQPYGIHLVFVHQNVNFQSP